MNGSSLYQAKRNDDFHPITNEDYEVMSDDINIHDVNEANKTGS